MTHSSPLQATVNAAYTLHARVGTLGIVGIGCWVVALMIALIPGRNALIESRQLTREIAALDDQSSKVTVMPEPSSTAPPAGTELPRTPELTGVLSTISKEAREAGLSVSAAEYRLIPQTESALAQYEISFDIAGQYVPVRRFLQSVLNQEPALALRQVSFERATPAASALQSKIRMVVFIRPDST